MSKSAISQNRNDYFPLAVGNYWVYYEYNNISYQIFDSIFNKVLGTIIKENNITYFAISESMSKFSDTPNRYYRLDDSSRVYCYCNETKKEYLLDKLEAKIGETWISDRFEQCSEYKRRHATMREIDTAKQTILINYNLYNPNPPGPEFNSIDVHFKKGVGLTYFDTDDHLSRSLRRYFVATNGVEKERIHEPDLNYSLSNNYPNPFNPSTNIKITLKHRSKIILTIYDMMGRRIKTLFEGDCSSGDTQFAWNGKDDNNKNVSSGVYCYRISIMDKNGVISSSEIKKMMLMR